MKKYEVDMNIFNKAIHSMNLVISDSERLEFNRFKGNLWALADKLVDYGRLPNAESVGAGDMLLLCNELKKLINEIPTLSK